MRWHPVSQNCKICNNLYAALSESIIFVLTIKYCKFVNKLQYFCIIFFICSAILFKYDNFHMFFTSRYIEAIRKLQSQGTTFLRTIHMTFVPGILFRHINYFILVCYNAHYSLPESGNQ